MSLHLTLFHIGNKKIGTTEIEMEATPQCFMSKVEKER
jgi:hypothetical protein